jgi:hypothetical protein
MATIHARTETIFARDTLGQFLKGVEARQHRVIEKGVERGARYSRQLAPRGKPSSRKTYANRPGYVPLKNSIRTRISINGNQGYWYSIAPHAGYVEEGTAPHIIQGQLVFWWRGGFFYWDNYRYGPVGSGKQYENWTEEGGAWVRHPGTEAQPFLRPAYERLTRGGGMQEILREEFRR